MIGPWPTPTDSRSRPPSCTSAPRTRAGARDRLRRGRRGPLPRPRVPARPGPRRRPLRGGGSARRPPGSASTPRAGSPSRSGGPRALPFPDDSSTSSPSSTAARRPREIARVLRPGGQPDRSPSAPPRAGSRPLGAAAPAAARPAGFEPVEGRRRRRRQLLCRPPARRGSRGSRRLGCGTHGASRGCRWRCWSTPPPAAGRTLKLLPKVEQALDARRVVFRVQRTKGLEHGVEQALRRDRGGRGAGRDQRRRPGRRDRRRDGRLRDAAGDHSRRPRQRPRPGARHPRATPRARSTILLAGDSRRIDVGEVNGKRFLGIVSVGFDSEANRRRQRNPASCAATSSTPTRRSAPCWAGSRPASRSASTTSATASPATRSRSPTTRPSAAACSSPPTPSSTTASSTSSRSARSASCASWVTCRRCSRAPTSRRTRCASSAPRTSS